MKAQDPNYVNKTYSNLYTYACVSLNCESTSMKETNFLSK